MNKSLVALSVVASMLGADMDVDAKPKHHHAKPHAIAKAPEKPKTDYPEFWQDMGPEGTYSVDIYVLVDGTRAAFFKNFSGDCFWIPEWAIPKNATRVNDAGKRTLPSGMKHPACTRNGYTPRHFEDNAESAASKRYQPRGGYKETFQQWEKRTGGVRGSGTRGR
ncbi:MAG: hypothetical protein WCT36_00660 [Candidatus Gracilibacteria bacterium]